MNFSKDVAFILNLDQGGVQCGGAFYLIIATGVAQCFVSGDTSIVAEDVRWKP